MKSQKITKKWLMEAFGFDLLNECGDPHETHGDYEPPYIDDRPPIRMFAARVGERNDVYVEWMSDERVLSIVMGGERILDTCVCCRDEARMFLIYCGLRENVNHVES